MNDNDQMLDIDGSHGEGGGQIVRSALSLSLVSGRSVTIANIRAGRKKSGLLRQHLTAVKAAAEISGANVQGDQLHSSKLVFEPGPVHCGSYTFRIGTAGSTTLVLQTILPALMLAEAPSTVFLEGGTHNPFAPPFDFLKTTFLPILARMGPTVNLELDRYGFFPAGGGKIRAVITPSPTFDPLCLTDGGKVSICRARALVAHLPEDIGRRECRTIARKLNWGDGSWTVEAIRESNGPGNVVLAEVERAGVTEVFTGFGLCGTTHSQWTAEFEHLLGHGRGRGVGAAGHNAFEVFLQGNAYGEKGKWALLDHDLSTVIFDDSGRRLLGLGELQSDVDRWINRRYKPDRQRGWLVCGLHPGDGNSYRKYAVAEYLAGYAGPPPMVHLRRGERMRRYFEPGLEDGKTFVFWGRNYNTSGIPGPERSRTWVNQPDEMYGSKDGTPHRNGQARFANVEYAYRPNFATGDYREGVIDESDRHVVFEFRTPYIIGATPPNDGPWGIYEDGSRNGLLLRGSADCDVAISLDAGRTWLASQKLVDGLDLTDFAKGRSQYRLRFAADAKQLRGSNLEIRTVCQANVAVLPRLKDNGATINYEASGKAVFSMGPEADLAKTYVTDGALGEKEVTLTAMPNKPVIALYAAAHVASGSPPDPNVRYQIDYSFDSGRTWQPLVENWSVPRRGDEPGDSWSQSFCYGSCDVEAKPGTPIRIRFRNDGGKRYFRAEAHLIQKTGAPDPVKVTYRWTDDADEHIASHVFDATGQWRLATGKGVRTHWVEFAPVRP